MANNELSDVSSTTGPKTVIVTGGASGLGLAMARHFAAQGDRVVILDVNAETGAAAAAEVSSSSSSAAHPQATAVSFRKCDISSWDSQAATFKAVYHQEAGGRIDVVMANAGISEQGASSLLAWDEGEGEEDEPTQPRLRTLDVNLVGTIYCKYVIALIRLSRLIR